MTASGVTRERFGGVVALVGIATLLIAVLLIVADQLPPDIPRYPNVEGDAYYPERLEARLLGKALGSFQTPDSYETVLDYYSRRLAVQGWDGRWYTNRAGRCYTLLIIHNSPRPATPHLTSISFKLRQRFDSDKDAPAGCK